MVGGGGRSLRDGKFLVALTATGLKALGSLRSVGHSSNGLPSSGGGMVLEVVDPKSVESAPSCALVHQNSTAPLMSLVVRGWVTLRWHEA